MTVRASTKIAGLPVYAFAEVNRLVDELKAGGAQVIDFGVGDPRIPTPTIVRERCKTAVDEHATTGYPSYIGSLSFRTACADWMKRRFGVDVDPAKHVTATIGSKESCFHLPLAYIDPGDVVISPNPGYPPYARGTLFAGGENFLYPVKAENDFLPDLGAIPGDVLARTRMLWVNYPNSPTGALAPLAFYEEAAAFCRSRDILLVSDEAYSDIYFGDEPPVSALQAGLDHIVSVFSMSKRSAMTGWRCGYVVGDESAIAHFRKLKTNIDSGTPNFVQDASVAALEDESHVEEMRAEYAAKRDVLGAAFADLGMADCRPASTIHYWQRVPAGTTSVEFAKRLLDPSIAIVVTPGTWLSSPTDDGSDPGEGYVRLSLVPTPEECAEAARRLRTLSV